ncbi:uncharacterized protein LOC131230551 [Magnolia sinica]|uniref:uncharacterized protein LOC131230551 n=1 Tax=Magnolia sinica TaxID=86752 RepID=UPI0026594D36|nr:uncharacterized protein LOC131230551 [Magnolia sinica]
MAQLPISFVVECLTKWWLPPSISAHVPILRGLTPCLILWELWLARNAARFEGVQPLAASVIAKVKWRLWVLVCSIKGPSHHLHPWDERLNFQSPSSSSFIQKIIKWTRPNRGYVKLNVDGSALGNPGKSCEGGICKRGDEEFCFAFLVRYDIGSNTRAELKAIYNSTALCLELGFNMVQVESDSKLVVALFNGSLEPTWWWEY